MCKHENVSLATSSDWESVCADCGEVMSTTDSVKVTDAQKFVLKSALSRGMTTSSGRFGWSKSTLRAMEKKGLVTLVSESTWDAKWRLTDLGVSVARSL